VHRYAYQFEPAYVFRFRHASAFAHALFGGVSQGTPINTNLNYTKFMWSVGGGLDIELSRRISIRAGQIDYEGQPVPVGGLSSGSSPTLLSNGLRYSAGVVLRF
jgi:hypothetical protein